jgi:hemerythrin-like domain-containing protein
MAADAITSLKADHREFRGLVREFKRTGPRALKTKQKLANQIIELLTVHTYIENEVMYASVRELLPALNEDVLEAYEEHHVADVLTAELAVMSPSDERYDAKAAVLFESVTHHIEEEEGDLFRKVRSGLSRKQLQELGAQLDEARLRAPRSPAQPSAMKKALDAVLA